MLGRWGQIWFQKRHKRKIVFWRFVAEFFGIGKDFESYLYLRQSFESLAADLWTLSFLVSTIKLLRCPLKNRPTTGKKLLPAAIRVKFHQRKGILISQICTKKLMCFPKKHVCNVCKKHFLPSIYLPMCALDTAAIESKTKKSLRGNPLRQASKASPSPNLLLLGNKKEGGRGEGQVFLLFLQRKYMGICFWGNERFPEFTVSKIS